MRAWPLTLVAAIALAAGCAAQSSEWKVRDGAGWPVQTWDASRLLARDHRACRPPTARRVRASEVVCCDQPVSLNSYGPYAEACGVHADGVQGAELQAARTTWPSPPPAPTAHQIATHTALTAAASATRR